MTQPALANRIAVPFVDLGLSNEPIRAELLEAVSTLLDSGAFVNGPQVAAFERSFAAYCGTADCVGLASGLDALRLALLAAGIQPGDEVIVPAQTFVATLEAVTQAGGKPVLAEIGELDYALDAAATEAAVTSRTAFLLPVHLYGQMADMQALRSLAERRGLAIVEDACQAHGAERDGLRAGAGGLAGAFSFYPAKNLGAMGDAGALATDDEGLASTVRALREHGQRSKYRHDLEGYTARLDTIQAIVLELKLRLLDGWNEERRAAARFLSEALAGLGDLVLPAIAPGSMPVWHLYVVRTAEPDALGSFLRERGIATGRHYPEPVHLAPAYAGLGYSAGAFPIAEQLARDGLSLPIFPGISESQLAAVAEAVQAYFRSGRE
ncbi:MAG: DegT/DnrJ/EryC1/StrS family aminotransferase [Gaiellaceae bacterium MAG52_C11]|nr:DegT/DnrJ/EryC1/StrS family aminotransferase [Candidatus Gaiellasilicea maunaloa]